MGEPSYPKSVLVVLVRRGLRLSDGRHRRVIWSRRVVVCALTVPILSSVLLGAGAPSAGPARYAFTTNGWSKAIQVPGLKVLAGPQGAEVDAISCPSAGNCVAGGYYVDPSNDGQGFVVDEHHDRWGKAIEVPGLAALNAGGNAAVVTVSCGASGDCAAGGSYWDASFASRPFLATEHHGVWGDAIEVPGSAAFGGTVLSSVSCGARGDCSAAGGSPAFVVNERNGSWGNAKEVWGPAGGPARDLSSVSCGSPGNCTAGGYYYPKLIDGAGASEAFVISERDGYWGKATDIPGLNALNVGGIAGVESVSCASAGNCAAGGEYLDAAIPGGALQAFVANEHDGVWAKAIEVPGSGQLNTGGSADLPSISCTAPGDCSAGGSYAVAGGASAFVVNERNWTWGRAIEVPGLAALNQGESAELYSVSCASPGNCAAGGLYYDSSAAAQALIVTERRGVWGRAIEVPGSGALNGPFNAYVLAVSCTRAGTCAAGGQYGAGDGGEGGEGFVVNGRPWRRVMPRGPSGVGRP